MCYCTVIELELLSPVVFILSIVFLIHYFQSFSCMSACLT